MAPSSPEDDSKPAARTNEPEHEQGRSEAKFDSGPNVVMDQQQAAIANLLSLQSTAQQNLLNSAQHQPQEFPASYLSSPFGSGFPAHASSLLPAAAPQLQDFRDKHSQQQQQEATLAEQQRILEQQLPYLMLQHQQQQLLQSQNLQQPDIGYALGVSQQQFQQLAAMNNPLLALQQGIYPNFMGSTNTSNIGSILDWYNANRRVSAVPYSGAADAVADVASALPSAEMDRNLAEKVRNQTARLHQQNFAGSAPTPRQKTPPGKAKSKTKPQKRKEKGRPKRPLSAYNIFFQEERAKLLSQIPDRKLPKRRNNKNPNRSAPHGKISFERMAQTIGTSWRNCPPDRKERCQRLADQDKKRYQAEMAVWKSQQRDEKTEKQKLLQEQVDSETMDAYMSLQEQQRHKSDGKKSRSKSSASSAAGSSSSSKKEDPPSSDGDDDDDDKDKDNPGKKKLPPT